MDAKNGVGTHANTGAIDEADVHVAVVGGANDVALLHRASLLGFDRAFCALNVRFADG